MDSEIGGSPYSVQHGNSLVDFSGPSVDLLVTVAVCCHCGAQIGEVFSVSYVFSTNHDWVVHSSVLPHKLGLLCVDFETNSVGGSPYSVQHGNSLVDFSGPSVDLLVTVAGCCHCGAQIGEVFSVSWVFSTNHDWVVQIDVPFMSLFKDVVEDQDVH